MERTGTSRSAELSGRDGPFRVFRVRGQNQSVYLDQPDLDYPETGLVVPKSTPRTGTPVPRNERPKKARRSTGTERDEARGPCPIPRLSITLNDHREILVNGQKVRLPAGVGRRVRGDTLKALAGIYQGMNLYLEADGKSHQVRDNEEVELHPGDRFKTRRPTPKARTVPRFLTAD